MTRDELADLIMTTLALHEAAIRERPRPPAWHATDTAEHDADLAHGPRYSPTLFGSATVSEAWRARLLRTVHRLAAARFLTLTRSEAGRLQRVKLTPAGEDAAKAIEAAGDGTETGAPTAETLTADGSPGRAGVQGADPIGSPPASTAGTP